MSTPIIQALGSGSITSGSNLVITVGATTTAGHSILIAGKGASGHYISSVSDSRGNTYVVNSHAGTGASASIVLGQLTTALQKTDTITITWSSAATTLAFWAKVWETETLTFDKASTATNTGGTSPIHALVTPATAGEFFVVVLGTNVTPSTGPTLDSPFANLVAPYNVGTGRLAAVGIYVNPGSTAVTGGYTWTGSISNGGLVLAAYKITGGGASTYTEDGALAASGTLGGTASVIETESGALSASDSLTGTASVNETEDGSLAASGAVTGTPSVKEIEDGSLAASGAVTGTPSIKETPDGSLAGTGALTGTPTFTERVDGSLAGTGALTGTPTVDETADGALSASGAVTGTPELKETEDGSLAGTGALTGTAHVKVTADGDLSATGDLTGDGSYVPPGGTGATGPVLATPVSHSVKIVARYTVLKTGVSVGVITTVLTGAYVTLDTTAENIATVSFSCLDPTHILAPEANGDGVLVPDGVEVQIAMGFQIGDTPPVLWTQGVYGVTVTDDTTAAATIDSGGSNFPGPGPNLSVTGYDRSRRISTALFDQPFIIPTGTPMGEAILSILEAQAPWCVNPNIAPTTFEVKQQVLAVGTDPWAAIVDIAASAGMVAYFDPQGFLVVRTAPTNAGSPTALSLVDGPQSTAMSMTAVISNTPGYNGVIVVSSSAGAGTGYSGSAYTDTPNSDLYALGPYGKRPAPPITISAATSNEQCQAMAQVLLSQYLGLSRSVVADMVPCPFLWAYDLAFIQNENVGVTGVYILQQATRYLDYTQQEADTWVPMGTPISQLAWLQQPAVAAVGSITPLYTGAYAYTPTTWKTYGSGTFGGFPGSPGFSWTDFAGAGLLGFGGGWATLWGGGILWRALRGGWGGSSDEDVVDDAVDDVEDVEDL